MDGVSIEALGLGGTIAAALVALVLWKLLKLAFKAVVFVVVAAALAGAVALYLRGQRPSLPVPAIPAPSAPG